MMPRRNKPKPEELTNESVLALPPPQVVTHHPHKKEIDPYQAPAGAVPGKMTKLTETSSPLKRKRTASDIAEQERIRQELRAKAARYEQYIELQIHGADKDTALATVYGVSLEEVRERRLEFLADVRSGLGATEIGAILEENDLSLNVRAKVLRQHMFSENPAASLKAVQMIGELEGERGSQGSFEEFLRMAKAQKS